MGVFVFFGVCPQIRVRISCFLALASALALCVYLPSRCSAQDWSSPKRVLILYSFDNDQGIYSGFDRVLRSQLRLRVKGNLEFYTEYLDLIRFPAEAHADEMVRLLKLKYAQKKPDLLIPVSYSAVEFLNRKGADIFPAAPMVALFNRRRLDEFKQSVQGGSRTITGVASTDDPACTLGFALQLQPDTQHVAVLVGSSILEHYWLDQLQHDLGSYSAKVDLRFLTGKPISELIREISDLPPKSVVLTTFFFQDSSWQFFRTEDVLDLITRESHVPVYSIYSSYIGHGVVGGCITDPEVTGKKVADLAGAVLNGENAGKIPIAPDDSSEYTVDWRELKRWGINDRRLPPSTLQLYRERPVWERYRGVLIAVVCFTALQTVLIIGLIVNIRRRRRAEKDLLREKTVADAVIESLPGVFVLQDQDGKNVRWNRNAETILRYKPAEVTPLGNVAEEHKEQVLAARERVLKHGAGQIEAEFLLRNGKTAPFYINARKVDLQGKPHFTAIGLDLTEREQTRQALRESESALRSFIENAPYGIATIDVRRDRFLYANPAMIKLLGYESLPQVCALTLSGDLYPQGANQPLRVQPTRADYFKDVEFTWKRRDGKPVIVRTSGRRISRPDSDVLEIIAEDVTGRRSLEDQLQHAQKLEALGQLSGSVAHDFNNLLSVIIGYSEILSSDATIQSAAKTQLETIKRAAERAASLTGQLLAFSRRQVLQPSVINLNSLVRETERMLRRLMPEDIDHEIETEPSLWKTKADPNQIVQVIINLAVNARDAMPRGGALKIQTANIVLEDGASIDGVELPSGDYVKMSVTDTGTGIGPETRSRIFEPFFTTKEPGKGTGLGLATVYGIVKQSGGFIFADSQPGAGTTFTVYLPRFEREATATAIEPGNGRAAVHNHSETLLIVEDEAAFRDLLRDSLRAKGFNVLVASNGVEALRVFEECGRSIRLLITDVIMPQMSGPELVRALRATREIDVLYMTGYADDKLQDLSESGELALMRKPFYLDELLAKIVEVLTRTANPRAKVPSDNSGHL